MKNNIYWYIVLIMLTACSTNPKFIPIEEDSDREWNDNYDPEKWRERFKKCRAFMYMENDAWHWCMRKATEELMREDKQEEKATSG